MNAAIRIRTCVIALFLLTLAACSPAWAQAIQPLSGDASANIGFNNLTGIDNKKHVEFGFAGGVNLTKQFALLAEYNYLPQGSVTTSGIKVSGNYQMFGAAFHVTPVQNNHVAPYFAFGTGYARAGAAANASGVSVSESVNGSYVSFGGGVSIYFSPSWGIRPEYRWDRQLYSYSGVSYHQDASRGMVALFYQFGGKK